MRATGGERRPVVEGVLVVRRAASDRLRKGIGTFPHRRHLGVQFRKMHFWGNAGEIGCGHVLVEMA